MSDLAEKLKDYNFTDEDDNPLELCNEYQRLVAEHLAMKDFTIYVVTVLMTIPFGENQMLDGIRKGLQKELESLNKIDLIEKNNG